MASARGEGYGFLYGGQRFPKNSSGGSGEKAEISLEQAPFGEVGRNRPYVRVITRLFERPGFGVYGLTLSK